MSSLAARFLVSGRVQGVAFRAHARAQAHALQLRGYARNLADGRVEVLAVGSEAALECFAAWLQHGPPAARVTGVAREPAAPEAWSDTGFAVG